MFEAALPREVGRQERRRRNAQYPGGIPAREFVRSSSGLYQDGYGRDDAAAAVGENLSPQRARRRTEETGRVSLDRTAEGGCPHMGVSANGDTAEGTAALRWENWATILSSAVCWQAHVSQKT